MIKNPYMTAVDNYPLFVGGNLPRIDTHYRIILEKMRRCIVVGQIIDGDNLDIGKGRILINRSKDASPYPAKAVDAYSYSHDPSPPLWFL
jgi:hypothetical protein